jgi:hypothetical protein
VPAACASGVVYNSGRIIGNGNEVFDLISPYFPLTDVECCVICWQMESCVASAFLPGVLSCEVLIHVNGTSPSVSKICQKGVVNYPFGAPNNSTGNIYPGPCGR